MWGQGGVCVEQVGARCVSGIVSQVVKPYESGMV
jgi:hypothetical protein